MRYGYVRVSTEDQNVDMQVDSLLKEEVLMENIYIDYASGTKENREKLQELLNILVEGDEVYVWKLDRLARSTSHILRLIEGWGKKGIFFKSVQEPFMDSTSPYGKFIIQIFAALAEMERNMISERTKEALKSARERGRIGGRRKGLCEESMSKALKVKELHGSLSIMEICNILDIKSKTTYYRYLRYET